MSLYSLSAIILAALLILSASSASVDANPIGAEIKNLKKLQLISLEYTVEPISSIVIMVDQGSITFVKAKNWDRKELDDALS